MTEGGPAGREPSLAVGAVVRRDGELLMVERGVPPAAGRWSVPGGHVEPGETLDEAVRREVLEETGVDVQVGELLGYVELSAGEHFVILDFLATPLEGAAGVELRPGDDAAAARWVPLGEVAALPLVDGLADFLLLHGVI